MLFIQKAFKILLERKSLAKSPLLSISQLAHSSFIRTKYLAKAYILGWKTRKLLGSNEIQNYKRNISDLIKFAKSQPNQQKFILKAKNDYSDAINRSLKNPSWWKTYIMSKSLQEKQDRVQKIRERNKRLKEQRIDISPSDYSQVDQIQSCKAGTDCFSGSMTMAFDFSSAAKRQPEEPARRKTLKQTEEKKQKKTNFLKRRANLKYDPAKSIKEEKNRVEKIIMQSDLNSECFGADENDTDLFASATAIKLSSRIQKGQASVKEIMNSSKGSITRSKPIVSENFQNLDYLKNVPRRID